MKMNAVSNFFVTSFDLYSRVCYDLLAKDPLHRAQGGHPSTDAGHHRQAAPAASQRHHQPPHEEHRSPDQQSKRKPSLQGDRPEPSHASQPPRDLPHASTAHKPQPKASPTSVEAHHEPRRSEHTGKPSASSPPATTHSRGHAPQPDRTQSSPATPAAVAPSKTAGTSSGGEFKRREAATVL